MTLPDGLRDRFATAHERLSQTYTIGALDRVQERISTLSAGDRAVLYGLMGLVCVSSLVSLYALEQSLLVTEPAYGGTLVEGVVGSPRFINPLLALSDTDHDLTALTYAGLMGLSGKGALIPVLAESHTVSDDGKTYTFTLRENTRFSDGSPLTANDVVFTVQKAQEAELKSQSSVYANWSGVAVVAVDTRTVRFTLSKPYAPFLELTTLGILPARLWEHLSNEEISFSRLQTNPVGAGPFKVHRVSHDASGLIGSISLVQNEYYALGRPYLDSIRFQFYPQSDKLMADLENGSIDSAHSVSTKGALTVPYARVFGVFWNQSEKQVYARAEVRKALSLALDREDIVSTVLGGYATPIMGPVPPDRKIRQFPIPQSENHTQAAAQVLQSAGWVYDGSNRVWQHASAKQTLDAITIRTANVPELKGVATAVKEEWEALGIPVSVELYELGDLKQDVIRPRKYSALLFGLVIGRSQDLYAFWNSQERDGSGLNIALYANKTVDALLESARANPDPEVRMKNLQKIEDLVAADYPAAFIYAPHFTYEIPDDLGGVELPQIVTPADRFAAAATWYRVTDAVWPFFARTNN